MNVKEIENHDAALGEAQKIKDMIESLIAVDHRQLQAVLTAQTELITFLLNKTAPPKTGQLYPLR